MRSIDFDIIMDKQFAKCESMLCTKAEEYTPNAVTEEGAVSTEVDRLAHFKKAAVIMNTTPKAALLGMLTKHLVSVSDMCTDTNDYTLARWEEKITDSINYLILLRALVEEEING